MAKASGNVQELLPKLVQMVEQAGAFQTLRNEKGRTYRTTKMHHFSPMEYTFTDENGVAMVARVGGSICFNITGIRPAIQAQADRVEQAKTATAKLSADERKELLEQLLAEA